MKLKIRYDTTYQVLELNEEEAEQLWVSLDLEGEALSQKEREAKIQEAWEEEFNKPEYNNWHQFHRHRGETKAKKNKDETAEDVGFEPLMGEVADDRVFRKDELDREEQEAYEDACQWVREVLAKKTHWAEAFISVRLDGMSVNDYAATVGVSDASAISHWLARAEKKLRHAYPNRQI